MRGHTVIRRLAVLAALTLFAGTAQAQMEPRRWSVGAHAGGYSFDKAAGLENAPFFGLDALYEFRPLGSTAHRIEPGLGFYASAALPKTAFDQFPVIAFDFGDTTFLEGVSQRVRLLEYGLQGSIGSTFGRFRPYVVGGAGFYTLQVDPRESGLRSYNEPAFQVGGGLNYVVSRTLGFRAEVRNSTWTSYKRDRLDATVAYTHDQVIRDELPSPVAAKSKVNNLKFALVFSYVPGGTGDSGYNGTTTGATP
jgi:hypothetical protein